MARKTVAEIRQMIRARMPGRQGEVFVQIFEALYDDITAIEADVEAAQGDITAVEEDVALIDGWGTTLATKLNADAGVTDVNYDTTPLA